MPKREIEMLREEFKACRRCITAFGDETRQDIIIALLEGEKAGMRVGEITAKTRLSRPAVSHHLRIMREAGLLQLRREGTRNFYCLNPDRQEMGKLTRLLEHINTLLETYLPVTE